MESPVLANSSMGTLDARTSVVAGLKRATDSGVVVVDAMLDAGDGWGMSSICDSAAWMPEPIAVFIDWPILEKKGGKKS